MFDLSFRIRFAATCFSFAAFQIRKPALTRSPVRLHRTLAHYRRRKTNVCFAAACFSFAASISI